MEQHRTLLIIVSVTLFVAVVIGVGLALLYPEASGESDQQLAASDGRSFDPIEYIREPEPEEPELQVSGDDEENDDVIVVYGEREDEGKDADAAPEVTAADDAAASGDAAAADQEPAAAVVRKPREPAKELGEPTPPSEPERKPAPAPEPELEPEPEYRRVTEYWIQVISSPRRDRVEQAKDRLETQELGGRITAKHIDGDTFYRLRVGPYNNKNEAEKFLGWISDIDGFAESYISEVYPLKRVSN